MDADLQHPPRYIPELLAKWQEGYEIVSTRRVKIDEQPFARRLGSRLFYALLNSISEFKMEPGTTDFRLLDRIVIVVFGGLLAFMAYDKLGSNAFGFSPIAFVIVSNVIMNGIVLGCIGLVALYIGHINTEVIGRPLYLVRKQVGPRAGSAEREPGGL